MSAAGSGAAASRVSVVWVFHRAAGPYTSYLGLAVSLGSVFRARCARGRVIRIRPGCDLGVALLFRPLQLNFVGALVCAAPLEIAAQRLPALGSNWERCGRAWCVPARRGLDAAAFSSTSHHSSGGSSLVYRPPRVAGSFRRRKKREFAELSRARRRRGATSLGPTPPPERPRGRLHPY